ncbi:hypothetical protein DFQ15_10629 [Xylophilus ampelinus]|uniref:Uncharacterized protein n=1 Tax=Xylophilus ampelinus TaxID=54067 RepID=A0A318SIF3_9BURK|nr:hypothetical protein DFQ15_10629 [Xylophilus ampelinus]
MPVFLPPFRIDGERMPNRDAPPPLSYDTRVMLQGVLGLSEERLAGLKCSGVTRCRHRDAIADSRNAMWITSARSAPGRCSCRR